uniref:Uncharacterized protein n=1 Tax=Manihot esculenta TaxID=3983 RepID=A0A2C9VR49_MANES
MLRAIFTAILCLKLAMSTDLLTDTKLGGKQCEIGSLLDSGWASKPPPQLLALLRSVFCSFMNIISTFLIKKIKTSV